MVTQDRVEKAAREYLRALISTNPASVVVKAILLGDSGGFTRSELEEISRGRQVDRVSSARLTSRSPRTRVSMPKTKQTRKVSRYQKEFGRHLKALKKKHPRSSISVLMKKAHRLTKRSMKK